MSQDKYQGHCRMHLLLKSFSYWHSIDQEMATVLNIYLTALKEFCMTFINSTSTNMILLKHEVGSWLFNISNRNKLIVGSFFISPNPQFLQNLLTRICNFFIILLIPIMNLSEQFLRHNLVNNYFTFIQTCTWITYEQLK
jgi:hypothetical protein